jgi:AraC family transcriptional regulator
MGAALGRDRLREFIDVIAASIDDPSDAEGIANRAFLSRYHFDRLVSAALGEAPGAFRRRLLLERAPWALGTQDSSVTDAAIEAGYDSVEGFGRAFARLFGMPPSRFRDAGRTFRAAAPNGIHFHPPAGLLVPGPSNGGSTMDLTDRLLEHDLWLTRRLLDHAASLSPDALDRTVWTDWDPLPFDADEPTVRSMLSRLVWTKENWTASIAGRAVPEDGDTTIEGLRRRLDIAADEFAGIVRGIRDRGEWEAGSVDALCDPPESFTFGGMVAHVLTFSAYRREVLIKAMHRLGVTEVGIGDPVEWERSLA